MKSAFYLLLLFAGLGPVNAQSCEMTLDDFVLAVPKGSDAAIQSANLGASTAQRDVAQAKAGLQITANGGWGLSDSLNSPPGSGAGITTAPSNSTLYSTTSNGAGLPVNTASVGQPTANGIIVQSPQASVTASLPLTTATLGWNHGFQTYPDGTTRSVGTGSLKVTQTIWNGYKGGPLQAAAEKSQLGYQIAALNAEVAQKKTVLAVKQAYFSLLSAQQSLAVYQTTLDSRNTTLQFVQTRQAQGLATKADVLSAQINVQSSQLDLVDGQNALATAKRRLANLVGMDPNVDFTVSAEPEPQIAVNTVGAAVDQALASRPELRIAKLNAESANIDEQLAQGSSQPSVAVSGGAGYTVDTGTGNSVLVGQVGVTLGAPLWDSSSSQSSTTAAHKTAVAAQAQLAQYLNTIPVDVQEAWNTWQQALARFQVAELTVQSAQLQNQIVRTQLDAGLKTITDELTAEVNVTTAQTNLVKARVAIWQSALQLQSLMGL